jgi:hypothetical protein
MKKVFLLLLGLVAGAWPTTANAQDRVEFNRLSSDQRQLAEQVRRLEKILLTLEQREEEDGNESKVELLRTARLKLADVGDERPLATILEEIASDLSELRAGNALEQQAELISILQELLDYLLETEREEQVQSLYEEAKRREAELRALADAQTKLREKTEALEQKERETGKTQDKERQALADAQAKLNQKMKEMADSQDGEAGAEQAEDAAEAGEDAEEDLRKDGESSDVQDGSQGEKGEQGEQGESQDGEKPESQQGEPSESEPGEQSESKPGEPSESKPGEPSESQPGEPSESKPNEKQEQQPGQRSQQPTPQDLKDAQEHQKEAEEKLKQAADQAKAEAEQLSDMQELEALINVLEKAEELAERHRQVLDNLKELVDSMDGASRVPRSARVQLRQWSGLQKQIGDEANELLFEIREHGADTFPFLLRAIVEDHQALTKRIGPPRYRANSDALELAAGLANDWQRLIDAIRIEMERLRKKAEAQPKPEGEGEEPPKGDQPLVSFAAEVQLLKMIQGDLRDRIEKLKNRQDVLEKAGIALDEDDLADLEQLAQRQQRLRSLFESILERLKEEQAEAGEDF